MSKLSDRKNWGHGSQKKKQQLIYRFIHVSFMDFFLSLISGSIHPEDDEGGERQPRTMGEPLEARERSGVYRRPHLRS